MIFIQIVLIGGFILFLYRVLADPTSRKLKAWTKVLASLFVVVAIVAVLVPDATNQLAKLLGVTRGADLLLYLLTLAFIFSIFSGYIQEKKLQERIVLLARKIAIIEANLSDRHPEDTKK
ncbi:MAG TPA: DUF2304 domain-containing protein [Candidatus Saccharimonadales bacterium]|jgi:hypothetical protein